MQSHGFFQSAQNNNRYAINGTQKNIIESVFAYNFQKILEANFSDARKALLAINAGTISESTVRELKQLDLWCEVTEICDVLKHPYPHIRLNLTPFNDKTSPPITAEATVHYINQLVAKEIAKLELPHPDEKEENSRSSCFDDNTIIAKNIWVVCIQIDKDNHAKIFLEGMRANGKLFIDCYEVSSAEMTHVHYIKVTPLDTNNFKPDSNRRSTYVIDDIQGKKLSESVKKDVNTLLNKMEVSSGGVTSCITMNDHSQSWAISKLKGIRIDLNSNFVLPKSEKRSFCSIM